MMDAFGVEIGKRDWKGKKGDKRNTKYALAGYGGAVVGSRAGQEVGARVAGEKVADIKLMQRAAMADKAGEGFKPMMSAARRVPGARAASVGALIGSVAGVGTAGAAYHAYRKNKRA